MTDPTTDRAAERPLTDRITEVLAAHRESDSWRVPITRQGPLEHSTITSTERRAKCSCGLTVALHSAHVAALLADLMGDGLADAWDEGWNECVDHRTCTYTGPGECPDAPPNPHRRVTDDGEDT